MKIAIMMRAIDQDSGFRSVVEGFVGGMLTIDPSILYLLLYRSDKYLGRFGSHPNVTERLVRAPNKLLWDQICVPWHCWREKADVIFNPKFSVPLISHCPVTMGLQEPAWWTWPEHYEPFNVFYMKRLLPLYIRRSSHLFPNSQFILDENRKVLGQRLPNATVAYSAADLQFRPIEDRQLLEAFRFELNLPQRFILSVTRVTHPGLDRSDSFHEGKNPETTVRAFMLCRDHVPHDLVLVGKRVREYLAFKGFRESDLSRVHLHDWVPFEKMAMLYNLANLFVIPSHYEGCPNTLLQAMACGCPVVASVTGGCPDIAGGAALLADPRDPCDFAEKIMRVLTDSALSRRMRRCGLDRAADFSWQKSARVILQVLIKLGKGHVSQ